ncbi:hypothetical protein ACWCXH_10085 [Kitasatospora sp. NPDC001660]
MTEGVMFDFSGTLFRVVSTTQWLDAHTAAAGLALTGHERAELVARLEEFDHLPVDRRPAALAPLVDLLPQHVTHTTRQRHRPPE